MTFKTDYDVIIIGGGPAGATAASFLSMKNLRVLVLEKEKFPRDHVGESLLPFCYDIFDELGILDQMKSTFVRKPGVRFVDSDGSQTTTWCFNRVIDDESYLSFQVHRTKFDKLLLDNARRHGATVMEETRADHVELDAPNNAVRVQATHSGEGTTTYAARFLLDCSGRDTFLASRQRSKKKFDELDRTALWTHWRSSELKGGLEEGLSLIVYLGGDKKGWIWVFPLAPDHITVGVVLNNAYIRDQKARLQDEGVEDWQMTLYRQELGYSSFVEDLLANAVTRQDLVIEGDYSYYSEQKFGYNYAMVGDAGTFIDPIFSSGIFLAMKSSLLVSNAVYKQLSPEIEDDRTLTEVYKKIDGAYRLVFKLIQFFYSADTINFAQMESVSNVMHQQHEDAMAVGHYLLAGDFFDRYDEYGSVIDILRSPKIFNLYKKMVISKSSFHATSCEEDPEVVFHAFMETTAKPSV